MSYEHQNLLQIAHTQLKLISLPRSSLVRSKFNLFTSSKNKHHHIHKLLLDGHFNQLRIFHVDIDIICLFRNSKFNNMVDLIRTASTFVGVNNLKINTIDYMTLLNKFTFKIVTYILF